MIFPRPGNIAVDDGDVNIVNLVRMTGSSDHHRVKVLPSLVEQSYLTQDFSSRVIFLKIISFMNEGV